MIKYKNNGTINAFNNIDDEIIGNNSEFEIGSLTKLFTMIVLIKMSEMRMIYINDPVIKYLDNTEIMNVKIIEIMNYIAGLKFISDKFNYERGIVEKYESATEVYNTFKDETLLTQERGKYFYSNLGYIILGAIIERVTDRNFKDVINELIIRPLNLTHTGFDDTNITLYDMNGNRITEMLKNTKIFGSSAGQMKSSMNDLIKFYEFPRLLSKTSLEILRMM